MPSKLSVIFILVLMCLFPLGCGPFQRNSPFSENVITSANNLNGNAIMTLSRRDQTPQDIYISAVSDNHQNYDDLEEFVKHANAKRPTDFVIHTGDFTNQGYNAEYDLFIDRIRKLSFPFLTLLGNHDTLVNGKALYKRLFGYFNSYFDYRGYRFILLNNNNLDFYSDGGVDWDWLQHTINSTTKPIVLSYHINPNNVGYFSKEDTQRFWSIVQGSTVRLMLHGHNHVFDTQFENGILRHQINRTQGVKWSRVILRANDISIEYCTKGTCVHETTQSFP